MPIPSAKSALAGYKLSPYRDHYEDYTVAEDIEDPSLPLYAQQSQVPRLPVPSLHDSAALFLRSARPHVSAEEFKTTKGLMEDLVKPGGLGEELQKRLQKQKEDSPNTSWLIKWWNKYGYLTYRETVVWNVSYYLQFSDEGPGAMARPTRRAARFIHHSLPFRDEVASGSLSPDIKGKTKVPMSNTQWKYLFNTCRMPGEGTDFVRTFAPDLHNHIVVARKNRFFSVDVYDPVTKTPLSVDAINNQLDRIVLMADAMGTSSTPVGVMTGGHRDDWLRNRNLLVQEPGNAELLYMIESAIFMVCLEDSSPVTREEIGRSLIHSDGRNRWWDKSVQLVVFENGKAGFVGEHAMMDGLTTTRFVNGTLDKLFSDPESNAPLPVGSSSSATPAPYGASSPLPEPQHLNLSLSPAAIRAVKEAEVKFDAFVASKELKVLMYHGYGKNQIKKFKVSPDAYAQLVIQLAYRKTFGHCRGTYESTQTRSFLHGRTEVTRSVSIESEAFCDAMLGKGQGGKAVSIPTAEERLSLLQKATQQHGSYIGKAANAQGCDRHLLGLKLIMQEGESHPFFSDPAYTRSGHWAISTSGLVGEYMDGWGFGEVVSDGIGVAYSVQNDRIRYTVSSGHQWADRMVANLESSLTEMAQLCSIPANVQQRSKL